MSVVRNRAIFVNLLTSILQNDVDSIERYIEGTKYVYPTTGWTALHWASDKKLSYTIMHRLIEANPKAIHKKCAFGQTPLHILMISRIQDENILKLIINTSSSLSLSSNINSFLRDNDGNNPIHLALKHFCPINIIKVLTGHYPKLIKRKNKDGVLPIQMFYITWYPIIRNFIEHDLHNQKQQSESNKCFLKKTIRLMNWHGSITVYDFFEIMFYLLHLNAINTTTTDTTTTATDKVSYWLSSFSNSNYGSCPWTFYELLIHLHITQIESNIQRFTNILITLVTTQNIDFYKYQQLTCGYCNTAYNMKNNKTTKNKRNNNINLNYITISRECDMFYCCEHCRKENEDNILSKAFDRVIPINESIEQLQVIYTLLRENPDVFIIATNNNNIIMEEESNKNKNTFMKRRSKYKKLSTTIQACSNIFSRKSLTSSKRKDALHFLHKSV